MATVEVDNIADCVKEEMHIVAQEKGGSFTKKEQKQALGKAFGTCRQKSDLVKICDGCKKEKPLFYQKLCKKCYLKRVKNYVDKYDMDENKLRTAINRLEAEMKERGIIGSEERETYYRAHLMPYFSTGMIKTNAQKLAQTIKQDAYLTNFYKENQKKLKEKKKTTCKPGETLKGDKCEKQKKIQQDAILGGIRQKLAEKKERSIFFKPFRPLETLHEVTQKAGAASSNNIVGMEYSDAMLKVTFNWEKLGEVEYGYDVGPDFYERMAKSLSKGKFLWKNLRGKTPGYVIDNPAKTTPGGVGGSIVPYTKITKRKIQGKEFKRLQKHYAGMLKGKVKVVAHMPFVRKRQKVLSRESKPFRNAPGDFVLIKIKELSDSIPVKGHYAMRGGKKVWIKAFEKKGTKAEELKKKIREKGIQPGKIPKTKSQIKQEKAEAKEKATTQRRAQSSEEKRRREIDKQVRAIKAPKPIEPREAAIQNLIEETGLERKEAEKQIAKLMGLTPEQAKKKAETKQREEQFKTKNKEFGAKLTALNELNKKIQSTPLTNIIKLLLKGFMLLATGKNAKSALNQFKNFYGKLQKEKKLELNQRKKLLLYVSSLHKEMEALSKSPQDFEYISAAVDQCAKRKIAQSGGKGSYNAYVAECIRIIGISRRRAGMSRRSGGTASEVRRGQRRVRTQTRRVQRGSRRHQRTQERRRLERQAIQQLKEFETRFRRQMNSEQLDIAIVTIRRAEGILGALSDAATKQYWERVIEGWQSERELLVRLRRERRETERQERIREVQEERRRQAQQERASEAVQQRRAEARATRRSNIAERIRRRNTEVVGATELNQSEARVASEVMHIEIPSETFTPESYLRRYGGSRLPPSYANLNPPPGTTQVRRGGWTGAGIWRNPSFRTPQQITQTRERRRHTRERKSETSEAARRHRRTQRGPKMRWRTRIELNGRNYNSLSDITRSDLQTGMRLILNPVAKKDYDFENLDFNPNRPEREGNRRRIQIRKGESAGIASFGIKYHPQTGLYLYLGTLKQKPDFRGRNASSILKPAIMWADSQNMVIGGSPTPIDRESEVAPAHLSREEQRTWAHNNSRDLNRFYRKLEGVPSREYGGTFARFPHPERIGRARSSDLMDLRRRFDQARGLIFFKNPKINIAEIGGYHFYYDPDKDLFYQLDTNAKSGK